MKCLVTGGAGFVGSHIIEYLLSKHYEIVCLDDFSTGKYINIENLENNIEVVEGDIRAPNIIQKAVEGVDYILHLAAQASVSRSVSNPLVDASINIEGTINILKAISEKSIKNFVYISTGGAIYGDPADLPVHETTTEKPISPYGLSKLVGEKYIQLFHKIYGIPYSIIRPANIYGPRQDPMGEAGVISIFLGRLMNDQPLEIFGDGYDTRDYIYVKDIAEICLKVMESPITDIFNAGTGKQTNLLELIDFIEKITNIPVEKKFCPPRPGDVQYIALDIEKAKKMLNWYPKIELTEGLTKTWDWFKSN